MHVVVNLRILMDVSCDMCTMDKLGYPLGQERRSLLATYNIRAYYAQMNSLSQIEAQGIFAISCAIHVDLIFVVLLGGDASIIRVLARIVSKEVKNSDETLANECRVSVNVKHHKAILFLAICVINSCRGQLLTAASHV